jgi:glycosyltransferase involved in cell wall biosynthesis
VGRIGSLAEKGFDLALEALRALGERFPGARLRIAGDGAGRAALEERAAALGVADRVEFLGFVHPDRVLALMNESAVVLMPSRVPEGFGLVALQAAQMARPVVATRVGGVAEVVAHGETGLLVAPGDAAGLARAVASLFDDPARAARMGRAARRRAETLFGWERHVDAYDELLQRLARAERPEAAAV